MTELFSKPAAGGIIEKIVDGEVLVLLQERYKGNNREDGLLEIPAGKIRERSKKFRISMMYWS